MDAFPFHHDHYRMTMGTGAIEPDQVLLVDPARYRSEVAQRAAIVRQAPAYYQRSLPGAEPLVWATVRYLLSLAARRYPDHFALTAGGTAWRWQNRLTGAETVFAPDDPDALGGDPLGWLGLQFQEDLLLMDASQPGAPLVAGHLCFAAGWCLDDKLGQSVLAIHAPVPGFADQIGRQTDLLMQRLKPGRPAARVNWAITRHAQLDQSPRAVRSAGIDPAALGAEQVGTNVFLRLERQTLSRYAEVAGILFTIHTTAQPLASVLTDAGRARRLAGVIRTLPEDLAAYKSIAPILQPLLAYLDDLAGRLPDA